MQNTATTLARRTAEPKDVCFFWLRFYIRLNAVVVGDIEGGESTRKPHQLGAPKCAYAPAEHSENDLPVPVPVS